MSPHYLVKCRTRSPDRSYTVSQKKMDSFENSRLLCCIATWILDKNTRLILAGHISRLMNGMSHGTVAWPCHERDVLVHCLAGRRTHLVGIIWQYATSPPHTDGSIVFARLRQYAPATNPWFFGTQQCVLQSPPPAVRLTVSMCIIVPKLVEIGRTVGKTWLFDGFWATVCKTVRPMLSVRCPSCLSVLSVTLVYCGQTVGCTKVKLGMQVGLDPGHPVLDGDPPPLP